MATKREREMERNYRLAESGSSVYTIYGRPSYEKIRAFEKIRREMVDLGGRDLKAFNPNTFGYSAAFEYADPETGVLKVKYYTKDNTYTFDATCFRIED